MIYGICNVLMEQRPFRKFRVGLIQINMEEKKIILVKILEKKSMKNQEKNWTFYSDQKKNYIITNLLPNLEIYELLEDYELELVKDKKSIYNYNFLKDKIHQNYKNLWITPCQSLYPIRENLYFIFLKRRLSNNFYEYYIGYFRSDLYELYIYPDRYDFGYKRYFNSFQKIKNDYYICIGLKDENYEMKKIEIPFKKKNKIKTNYVINGKKNLSLQTTDNLIHKYIHTSLLVIKIPLIIFTLIYFYSCRCCLCY